MKSHRLAAALCCLAGSLMATSAWAQQIYTNGPYVTHPGAHVTGADVSLAQDETFPGYTALGFAAGPAYRIADDFLVPLGHIFNIDSVVLYGYQTGSGDAPFTDVRVNIWLGLPERPGSIKVYDGSTANLLVSSTPDAYRAAQSMSDEFSNTERRIKRLSVTVPNLSLTANQYWLDWQLTGPLTGESFTPPVSILGQPFTSFGGPARYRCPANITDPNDPCFGAAGSWRLFENGTSPNLVDLPFLINGRDIIDVIFIGGFETPPPPDP
jgi:hypothetical protein